MSAETVRRDVVVAGLSDLRERERIVVDVDGLELGVYFHAGEVRAWHNVCPHQGGPVCQGKIMPRTVQLVREGRKSGGPGFHPTDRNIVCPWHGFEFDILTGRHPADSRVGLRPIPVRVEGDDVIVTI
ncbi:Rieske (2Fe-2S) protein [Amycolatopsis taiwanensis]|uniref:(2Fe-2S)-binding protein n=1 Tax=Amycolatopsis taiwanensis TaxID=342230 RepID=A0A9W6R5X6_9PSEU|nr:Rieske 2Fe-2S domain-containing protein [Amycolatopsis taiwanensis]GLY68940.1 (2Fe-2S)-binding protein [Amycolatopsis taiwanensis]